MLHGVSAMLAVSVFYVIPDPVSPFFKIIIIYSYITT